MLLIILFLSVSAYLLVSGEIGSLKGFDDTVLFKINWPGKNGIELLENLNEAESVVVTSNQQEKYRCFLPALKEKEKTSEEDYLGPNPIELLMPVFQQSTCTTLLESYWTYELCHGRYIRQYHEEREGKKIKLQEFYLGKWDKEKTAILSAEFDKDKEEGRPLVPLKKLDGVSLPYLQLNFTDGTLCDLNGKPRRTNVLYVCFASGKNDIFFIKETSTCEYEVIVISSELCKHPKYRPQVTGENDINCLPLDKSPTKPLGLMKMEDEGFKPRHFSTFSDSKNEKMFAVYSIDEFKDKDGRMQVTVELRPLDGDEVEAELPSALDESETPASPISPLSPPTNPVSPSVSDNIPEVPIEVNDFLRGKTCPQGGYGWWKYKFCYGDYIEQYHVEKSKPAGRHSIILGMWNREQHLEWLKKNPHKRPKPVASRTFITQFYSGGDVCVETGKPRETEVKLKCVQNRGSVSFYVLEPQPCQYILGFESSLICDFIHKVNDDALLE